MTYFQLDHIQTNLVSNEREKTELSKNVSRPTCIGLLIEVRGTEVTKPPKNMTVKGLTDVNSDKVLCFMYTNLRLQCTVTNLSWTRFIIWTLSMKVTFNYLCTNHWYGWFSAQTRVGQ